MKLVLAKDGVKREIEAPFELCCSTRDLNLLIQRLEAVRNDREAREVSYGWSTVLPAMSLSFSNTPPKAWTE